MSYSKVYRRIWEGDTFAQLDADCRYLALHLLTNQHSNSEGIYRLPLAYAAHDLGWGIDVERVSRGYALLSRIGFMEYHAETSTVLLVNALKFNAPVSEQQIKGAANAIADMRPSPVRDRFLDLCREHCPGLATLLTSEKGWTAGAATDQGETVGHTLPDTHTDTDAGGYGIPLSSELLAPNSEGQPPLSSPQADPTPPSDVEVVFDHWRERLDHPHAKLDDKRRKAITARLRDGYTVDDLKLAIDGILLDPHKMGQNDRARKFDDIELACRNATQVDALIDLAVKGNPVQRQLVNDRRARNRARGDEWEARAAEIDAMIGPAAIPQIGMAS